jgi:PAS domain S-box-containing protein
LQAIAHFWNGSIASAFRRNRRKREHISWVDASKIVRDITEQAPASIAMFDTKMRFLAVSRRFLSNFQLSDPAEVIGRSAYEVFPDLPSRWRENHVRVLAGEELTHEEDFFPRQDGRIYWVRWGGTLLFSRRMALAVVSGFAAINAVEGARIPFHVGNAPFAS